MRLGIVIATILLLALVLQAQPELAPLTIEYETDQARLIAYAQQGKPAERVKAMTRFGQLHLHEAVPDLLPILTDNDATVRATAARVIGQLCAWRGQEVDDRAVTPLSGLLKDTVPQVRAAAATALGDIRATSAADLVFATMQKDSDATVCRVAACALAGMDDPRGIEVLCVMLKTADPKARLEIIDSLAGKNNPQAITALIEILADGTSEQRRDILEGYRMSRYPGIVPAVCIALTDPDPAVRKLAADCLGMQGDTQAIPAMIVALQDTNADVARTAGKALAEQPLQENALDGLLAALKSTKLSTRIAALEGLHGSKDTRISTAVIPLMNDVNTEVREAAARTLGSIGDPHALQPLLDLLQNPDAKKRAAAAEALGELKNVDAVPQLQPLLEDTTQNVRAATAKALWKIRDPSTVDALLAVLPKEKDGLTRMYVVLALGACRDAKAVPPLLELLQTEKDDMVLAQVIMAFMTLRDPRCIDQVLARYPTGSRQVRRSCLFALASYQTDQLLELVVQALQGDDVNLRDIALQIAISNNLSDPRITQVWLEALRHPEAHSNEVRYAILILADKQDKRAITPLISILNSKKSIFKPDAIRALSLLGDKTLIPVLQPFTHDPDPSIALQSFGALLKFGQQDALEPLIAAARQQDTRKANVAIYALASSGNSRALAVLQSILLDPHALNRLYVAMVLDGKTGPEFFDPLLALFNDRDPAERKLAALALVSSDDPRATAIQLRILGDRKDALPDSLMEYMLPVSYMKAATALARRGNPEGISYLITAVGQFEQSSPSSQRNAAKTLAEITGQDFGLDADKWAAWWKEQQQAK